MKKLFKSVLCTALCVTLLAPSTTWASPREAEIDGFRVGRSTLGSLYQLRLLDSGITTAGTLLRIAFDVQSNVDYCLVTGKDPRVADIDVYVYHENGSLIMEDTTAQSRGAVSWRSAYSGTAMAYVHVKRTVTVHPGSYSVFIGTLEIPRVGKSSSPASAQASAGAPPQ